MPSKPVVVTLCGSTRFMDEFFAAGWRETLAGRIVLSVGVAKHVATDDGGHVGEALGPEVCAALDELHKRKIDLSDEILVLNVGGYFGESTASEIRYAFKNNKRVRWLEPMTVPNDWALGSWPPGATRNVAPHKKADGGTDGLPDGRDVAGTAPYAGDDRGRAGEPACPSCGGRGTTPWCGACESEATEEECENCGGSGLKPEFNVVHERNGLTP